MLKTLKIFIFFIALILTNNVNAKPVPPGAGEGDVPANILFLVDSSASMGRWIGSDGLGRVRGVSYDSNGNINCDSISIKNSVLYRKISS